MIESGCKLFYAKRGGTRRSEFDREWDVEATTNSGDHGRNARVRQQVWRGCARPLDEQPNRAIPQRVLTIEAIFCRHSERRYRINPLALPRLGRHIARGVP